MLLTVNVPKLAMAASLPALALYGAIAGSNVATLRAELMAALVAGGVLLDRPREWLAPVAAAAGMLALARPGVAEIRSSCRSRPWWRSSSARRAAAWWAAWEEARLVRLRGRQWTWRVLRWLVLSLAVTLCAEIGTAPLTAWHFNQVSLVAPLANLVVVPLLGVVTVGLGLLGTVAVAVWPALAPPVFVGIGVAIRAADAATAWLAAWPWAAVRCRRRRRSSSPCSTAASALFRRAGGAVSPSASARSRWPSTRRRGRSSGRPPACCG
ncbi:MAG: ComEC/Rec2 family competence protein [Candidatus Binatia bacterium]